MYLHLGQNEIIPQRRVIGIFDLDKCSYEKRTRDYLAAAEKEGVVLDISGDLPRSFVVCDHPYHEQIVYLSPLSPGALRKRAEGGKLEGWDSLCGFKEKYSNRLAGAGKGGPNGSTPSAWLFPL